MAHPVQLPVTVESASTEAKPAPILLTKTEVSKKWGGETWIANNDEFCGKVLRFNRGAQFSCHYHVKKREVFWLRVGRVKLMTINTEDASQSEIIMEAGDVVEIPRLLPHQITALEDSEVIEFSTTHSDEDSFRVLPGDSQKP